MDLYILNIHKYNKRYNWNTTQAFPNRGAGGSNQRREFVSS